MQAGEKKLVEFNDLSAEQKWRYLQTYFQKASNYYGFKESVISDDEVYAQIGKFKEKPKPQVRKVLTLDSWKWKLDPELKGVREGYFRSEFPDKTWEATNTPHNVNYAPIDPVAFGTIDADLYNGPFLDRPTTVYLGEYALWYRTSLALTQKELENKRAFLSFESCSIKTTAWVGEWPVILDHFGVYPFQAEITEELRKARKKQITLEVISQPTNSPDLFYNCLEYAYAEMRGEANFESPCLNWGGINGSVELQITSPTYLKDLFAYTETVGKEKSTIHLRLEIENTTTEEFEGSVSLNVKLWYPQEQTGDGETLTLKVNARPVGTTVIERDFDISNPKLWESWDPHLYLLHATLTSGGEACDDLFETFGIRTIAARAGKFYLNGRPIFMAASHDQGIYPDSSTTCPKEFWIIQDYLLHKAMGFIAARYPSDNRVHYRRLADYADQMGIMLIWEGYCSVWIQHPGIEDLATRDVPLMIRDLRNHPSIIVWVMGDETFYAHPKKPSENTYMNKRQHYNELVYKLASENDPSRLINPVGCWAEDLTLMIEGLVAKKGLSIEEARKKAVEMMPVFDAPNVYWSIHRNPSHTDRDPVYAAMGRYHRYISGAGKPVTFDEFGCEGMPNWELCKGDWWYERWTIGPMLPGGLKTLEPILIGRKIGIGDWKASQAYQASVLWRGVSYMRETDAFAGFGTGFLRDAYNCFLGLVDFRGRAKLPFFVMRDLLNQFFISAMHGNYLFSPADTLSVTVSNSGSKLNNAKLTFRVINGTKNNVIDERTVSNLSLPEGSARVLSYGLASLPPDLYSIEYSLQDSSGSEIGRSLDMFYVS